MNTVLRNGLAVTGMLIAATASAQVTLYEREGFDGSSLTAQDDIRNLRREAFGDRASSAVVFRDRWEVCDEPRFHGRCTVLRPGRYPSVAAMGLNDRVSSVHRLWPDERVAEYRYAPAPVVVGYEGRRGELLYEAPVTSVHAVVGPPEQRCWIEREQIAPERRGANVPGAVAGAVIGGILGHQVGGGLGKDIATAGGAVAGAAVGANVGRNSGPAYAQDVQRCAEVPGSARPSYWDVTYDFRGIQHRVQMTMPPGPSVTVNQYGEPRG